MKFSANDILSQTFSTKLMGYATEQVDEFLVSLANEWTRLVNELATLEASNANLAAELKECRRREHGLHDALQMAKRVVDEVRTKAESEAESLLEEAERDAEKIVSSAEVRLERLKGEIVKLREEKNLLKSQLRTTLQAHLQLLDAHENDDEDPTESPQDLAESANPQKNHSTPKSKSPRVKRRPDPLSESTTAVAHVQQLDVAE